MDSIPNTIHYCCVSKGTQVLSAYSRGDQELESLASLCVERTPQFHIWYFQTVNGRIFGFLMEDGYVYFAIADVGLGNPEVLRFLKHVKDGFNKVLKSSSVVSLGLNPCLHDELVAVLQHLISSLENVSRSDFPRFSVPSLDPVIGFPVENQIDSLDSRIDLSTSTTAPLLGKLCKSEKQQENDGVYEVGDIVLEENGKSVDRGIKIDMVDDPIPRGLSVISLQNSSSLTRIRGQQLARKLWWRYVRIVLIVDLVLCLVLFGIWLGFCKGFKCISH